jgi:hypothetical protein
MLMQYASFTNKYNYFADSRNPLKDPGIYGLNGDFSAALCSENFHDK